MHTLLSNILEAFALPHSIVDVQVPKDGNINRTYLVTTALPAGDSRRFVVQGVNSYVFPHPEEVMANIRLVSTHLTRKAPEACHLRFYETAAQQMLVSAEGWLWRVCDYIPSYTYSGSPSPTVAKLAGAAFGRFQRSLADLDPASLYEIIPSFHDTESRYRALHNSIAADAVGRAAEVQEEIRRLLALEDRACTLTKLQKAGRLPLRVTHNDTKISNILFDPTGTEPVAVIDLDTVMPGLIAHDYGDAIRSAANRSISEDDLSGAVLDSGIFEAFTAGFLGELGDVLTNTERETLSLAPFVMTTETAVRFLTDYLMGDLYFRPRYPGHNLRRARMQLSLAEDLLMRMPEIDAVIQQYLP